MKCECLSILSLVWTTKKFLSQRADEYTESKTDPVIEVYQDIRNALDATATRRTEYYDTRVKATGISVGTWVWYHYQRRTQGFSPKWQSYYVVTYLVVRILSQRNLIIQRSKQVDSFVVYKSKVFVSHYDVFGRYRTDSDPRSKRGRSSVWSSA